MGFDTLEINLVESNVRSEALCIDQIPYLQYQTV